MKLHSLKFAGAGALAAGISYSACAALFYYWPSQSLEYTAQLLHLKSLAAISSYMKIDPMNFLSGLLQIILYAFITLWIMAVLYNYSLRNCACSCGSKYGSCSSGVKPPQQPPVIR